MDLGKKLGEQFSSGGAESQKKSWGRIPLSGGAKNFWGSAQTPLPTMEDLQLLKKFSVNHISSMVRFM